MKQLLAWPIALSGWFLAGFYFYYEWVEYGAKLGSHLVTPETETGLMFHLFIFGAPLVSTYLGYVVHERMKLMGGVRELEARYRDYFENAPVAYHTALPDQTIMEVNGTWLRLLGYGREEVAGRMKFSDLVAPDFMNQYRSCCEKFMKYGEVDNSELVLVKKDGSSVPVIVSATMVRDEQGRPSLTRTILRDISERKAYEAALTGAAEEWRTTFDSMPWGVMLIDRQYNIMRANRFVSEMSNTAVQEIIGRKCFELMHGGHGPIEGCPHALSMLTGSSNILEYNEEGSGRHFRIFCSPVIRDGRTQAVVHSIVDITDIRQQERKLIDSRNAFFNMLKDISSANRELQELYDGLVFAFANAIDAKSHWTKGHSERVSRFAVSIAQEMKMKQADINRLRTAALLHDIGKIGTYDYLLDKPEKLTEEEYEIVKEHPMHSARILEPLTQLADIIDVIKFHHERWDGRGYPLGLKAEGIPQMARILCVADSFDSMTADRPYRPAPGVEYAIKELRECSGTHFDPGIVEVFLAVLRREGHMKERFTSAHGSN